MHTRHPPSLPFVALALLVALSGVACREQVIVGEEPGLLVPVASQDAGLDALFASQDESDDVDDQRVEDEMESEQDDGEDSSRDDEDSNDDAEDTQDNEND